MHPHEKKGGVLCDIPLMCRWFLCLKSCRRGDIWIAFAFVNCTNKETREPFFFFMRIYGRRNWVDSCIRKTNWIFSIESSWWINRRKCFCHCVNTVLVKMTGTVLVLHKANKKWALERGCVRGCTNALYTCLLPTSTWCVIDACL